MPIASYKLPDGRIVDYQVPKGMSPEEIDKAVASDLRRLINVTQKPSEKPYVPKEEAGFFNALGEGLSTLGAVPETVQYAFSPDAATRKAAAKAAESDLEYQQLLESKGIGDVLTFAKQQAGQAIGFMGAPLAAGAAAAAVSGPLAPITGTAAFLTTAATQYFANTVGRQAQVQEAKAIKGEATEAPDITKALLSSAGQAGLDVLGFRVFKPLGALVGLGGKKAVGDQAEAIVSTALREGADKAAETLLGAAAKGATFEAAQETVQTVLERWGAGLNLGDDEAIREYFESAAAGGLLGGPLGAGSKFVQDVRNKAVDDLIAEGEKEASGLAFNPQTAADNWSLTEKKIKSEATPLPLVDANNQPLSYTPNVLETFGFSPDFAAVTSGTTTLNADQVIGKSVQDQQVTSVLFRNMVDARNDLGRKLKNSAELSRMTPDEMQSNIEQYEKLTLGINSLLPALLKPADVKYTPASLVVKQGKDGKFFIQDSNTGHKPDPRRYDNKKDAEDLLGRLKNNYNDKMEEQAVRNANKALQPKPTATTPSGAAAATTPTATATTPPPVSRLQEKINALAEDYGEGMRNLVKNEGDFNNVAKFLNRLNVAENDLKQLKRTKSPLVENKQKEVNELNEAFDSALSTGDLSKIKEKQAAPKTEAPKATKPDEEARKSGEVTVTKFEEGVEDTFVKPAKPTSYSEPLPPVVTPEEISARIEASGQAKKAKEVAKKVKKDACE